jgi:bifunctional N-acetylglucosamine-1-phosphate-uridyltransferase/glucosamine-1-phosphate-acetyltransferase GlmU-like protein
METIEKISITSKTLSSGNQQVKFFVEDERKPQYGYLLVTETKPVGDIIEEIKARLERRRIEEMNLNPFFPLSPTSDDPNFYLFSA